MKPLVVLCAGKGSLHRANRWHRKDLRAFQLWLVVYEDDAEYTEAEDADRIFRVKGSKWDLIRAVAPDVRSRCQEGGGWVWFPDDDLEVDVEAVNAFFEILNQSLAGRTCLAQPSLAPINVSCRELVQRPGGPVMRKTGFVEIQMPCVSRDVLDRFLDFVLENPENKTGWGMDCLWSEWKGVEKWVVDGVVVVHTRPVDIRRGFYAGLNPAEEKMRIIRKYRSN